MLSHTYISNSEWDIKHDVLSIPGERKKTWKSCKEKSSSRVSMTIHLSGNSTVFHFPFTVDWLSQPFQVFFVLFLAYFYLYIKFSIVFPFYQWPNQSTSVCGCSKSIIPISQTNIFFIFVYIPLTYGNFLKPVISLCLLPCNFPKLYAIYWYETR